MKNIHKLTEGAVLLAVFAVLLLITLYVPLLGSIVNFVLPLPFIIFAAKNNLKYIAVFFVASAVITFIVSSFTGLVVMFIFGLAGSVMGYLIHKNKSRSANFIISSLFLIAATVILYIISRVFFQFDMIQAVKDTLNQSLGMSQELLKIAGQGQQAKQLIQQNKETIKQIASLLPSILVLGPIMYIFIIQAICFPIVKRFKIPVEGFKPFRDLRLPKNLLWYYLIALALSLIFHPQAGSFWQIALLNLAFLLQAFIAIQGFALLFYFLHQRGISNYASIFIAVLAFIIPILLYIVGILGIMDLGFDLRKRISNKE